MRAERLVDLSQSDVPVRGMLHYTEGSHKDFLVLTHGASGNCNAALLVALAEALAQEGVNVLRCDLPYRQRKPSGPPSPGDARQDQQGLKRAVTLMKQQFSGLALLGGSSYGGRQASILAASEVHLVEGLLLLSYPLHPPGRPQQLRTQHFPELKTPSLFVSGTRDAFASVDELQAAIKLIPSSTELVVVEGAAHGLSDKKRQGQIVSLVTTRFLEFFAR